MRVQLLALRTCPTLLVLITRSVGHVPNTLFKGNLQKVDAHGNKSGNISNILTDIEKNE
jgi:hypothetical protein